MNYKGIEAALLAGAKLHSFRSGGGLRVVRLEKYKELLGYGEHPYIHDALEHADQDYLEGHKSYKEQYSGKNAKYPHYLTGAYPESDDELDIWVFKGNTFDAYYNGDEFVCKIIGYLSDSHSFEKYEEKVGKGTTFQEAIQAVLTATIQEIETA